MARVTVEDCIIKIPNRFELVMTAAQRARDIAAGGQITIDRDDDKNPVVALREIADETIDSEGLQEALVRGLQKHVEVDEPEEDGPDLAGDTFGAPSLDDTSAEALGMSIRVGAEEAASRFEDVDGSVLEREA